MDNASSATSAADADGARLHVGAVAPYGARGSGSKFAVGARTAAKIFSCRRISGRCEGDAIVDFNREQERAVKCVNSGAVGNNGSVIS